MTALLLAAVMAASMLTVAEPADAEGCGYTSRSAPPSHIDVFRLHRRGSSIPARVERWSMRRYVAAVMVSGAWPARPVESGKVGAIAIKQYAWWQVLHTCRRFRGRSFAITDSEQFLERHARPDMALPERYLSRVRATWGVSLRKSGRLFRTGWSGDGGRCGQVTDGWHLLEDGVTDCARRGYGWRRIVRIYLSPVRIVKS